jgi:hypothetical protein
MMPFDRHSFVGWGSTQVTVGAECAYGTVLGPNPRQVHLYHLRRSGGHALADWILGHHCVPKVHYNQAAPLGLGMIGVHDDQLQHFPGTVRGVLFPLVSFEDIGLGVIAGKIHLPRQVVLLLRDPFNTLASRLAMARRYHPESSCGEIWNSTNRCFPTLWKQYAREFVEPHYLPHAVRVNFNRWYASVDYRREISQRLGWSFDDRGFASRDGWRFSQGSSFGETDPQHLNLLDRWQHFRDDQCFRRCFDDETRRLSQAIFDFVPPLA